MKYEIVPINFLVPLEKVFPSHLKNLENMINRDGFMLKAIIIDRKTGIVLDGSHRYVYLLKNGFKEAPVHIIDYNSEDVRVGTHLGHRFLISDGAGISKATCIKHALTGNLLAPRTTRHFFTFRKVDISLSLDLLKKGDPVDVSNLISNVSVHDEIEHNKKYINEINEEIEIIVQYLEEVSQTKRYLTKQIALMNESREIAFFPGKFHPPHIGHIQTILNLLPKYRKIIIGVSEDIPKDKKISEPKKIVLALKDLFGGFENIEIFSIKGVLTNKKNIDDLHSFDVLLSGNQDVLVWASRMGLKAKFVPRSEGHLFSGTEIRERL